MTALDRTLIKAFHRPPSRSGAAVVEPPAAVPTGTLSRVAVSPAVPLSQALAELAVVSEIPVEAISENLGTASVKGAEAEKVPVPSESEAGNIDLPSPSGSAAGDGDLPSPACCTQQDGRGAGGEGCLPPATAPVSLSIAAMLDQAFAATTINEPTTASVSPSIAALMDEAQVFQATTVTETTTAAGSWSIATLPEEVQTSQATTATVDSPLPAEQLPSLFGRGAGGEGDFPSTTAESGHLETSKVAPDPYPMGEGDSQPPVDPGWSPLLQVDRVVWPNIHGRLQSTAAIQQMTEGLLSICASGSKVLGLASCASGEGVTTLLLAAAQSSSIRAGRSCSWMPTGTIRNWPKAWASCRSSAGKKHSPAACRWKKS